MPVWANRRAFTERRRGNLVLVLDVVDLFRHLCYNLGFVIFRRRRFRDSAGNLSFVFLFNVPEDIFKSLRTHVRFSILCSIVTDFDTVLFDYFGLCSRCFQGVFDTNDAYSLSSREKASRPVRRMWSYPNFGLLLYLPKKEIFSFRLRIRDAVGVTCSKKNENKQREVLLPRIMGGIQ